NEVVFEGDARRPGRDVLAVFIAEQLNILQSNDVLETVVKQIGVDQVQIQDTDPREGRELGVVQRLYREIKQKLDGLFSGLEPSTAVSLEEQARQRAMNLFRRRSYVRNDRRSHLVKVGLYGTHFPRLKREMDFWLESYRMRIAEITRLSFQKHFDDRVLFWGKEEKSARQKLDQFKRDNPGVSKEHLENARLNVISYRYTLDRLQRQLAENPGAAVILPSPPPSPLAPEQDTLAALKGRKNELATELAALRGRFPPGNEKIKSTEQMLKSVEEEIRRKENPLAPGPGAETAGKSPEELLRDAIARVDLMLRKAVDEESTLRVRVSDLDQLVLDHGKAGENLRRYRDLMDLKEEQTQSRMFVDIKVTDEPRTSANPIGGSLGRVPLGTLGGLAVGLLLAFAMELLNPRVRFKRDLEDELGLRVVAVLPGR
ncbi:MAG: hypothetical protein ACRD2T_12705, partial [Thermoanaerobaculia bacterium]